MITPTYQPHKSLEAEALEYLSAMGYDSAEPTYHATLPTAMKVRLQRRWSLTALYLRGRADRIAIHRTFPLEFEWEAKTHASQRYHDMCIEALPLCHHLSKAALGVRCLYVYQNPIANQDAGFWVDAMPAIRNIFIPGRWTGAQHEMFSDIFQQFLPGVRIVPIRSTRGSGDPYIVVDKSAVGALPHWKDLIRDATRPP